MQHIVQRVQSLEQADALLKDLFHEVEESDVFFNQDMMVASDDKSDSF